jgi:ribosomal RNA-processing protein 9
MKFEHYLSRLDQKDIVKGFDRVEIKGHMRQITCCRFVPLKPMLISAAKDGSILYCRASLYQVDISDSKNTVRKVLSHGMPKDPNGHSDEILCMDISFDGKFLITGGRDCFIKIWNLTTMSFVGNLEGHKNSVNVEE